MPAGRYPTLAPAEHVSLAIICVGFAGTYEVFRHICPDAAAGASAESGGRLKRQAPPLDC